MTTHFMANCVCDRAKAALDEPVLLLRCLRAPVYEWQVGAHERICLQGNTFATVLSVAGRERSRYRLADGLRAELALRVRQEEEEDPSLTWAQAPVEGARLYGTGGGGGDASLDLAPARDYSPGNLIPHSLVVVGGVVFFFGIFLCYCAEMFSSTNGGSFFGRGNGSVRNVCGRESQSSRHRQQSGVDEQIDTMPSRQLSRSSVAADLPVLPLYHNQQQYGPQQPQQLPQLHMPLPPSQPPLPSFRQHLVVNLRDERRPSDPGLLAPRRGLGAGSRRSPRRRGSEASSAASASGKVVPPSYEEALAEEDEQPPPTYLEAISSNVFQD